MQGYFTGGLYVAIGLVGLLFVAREYFFNDNLRVLDFWILISALLIGVGFLVHTYFSRKNAGKDNLQEERGCFLPDKKK